MGPHIATGGRWGHLGARAAPLTTIVRVMALIAIMTLIILPTTHIIYLITIASHLSPEVVILLATQLQLPLELTFASSPTVMCRAASWLTTVDHEMSVKHLPHVAE
jgi:hypothetical protein